MDPDSVIKLIILILLLLLSAFFSSAETALTTVNKIKLRTMADDGDKRAAMVLKVTDNTGRMLTAILIGNNIVNLSASSIATMLGIKLWGSYGAGAATGILTFLILVFGEIVPKTAASERSTRMALLYAPIILGIITVLTPFVIVINAISKLFLRLFKIRPGESEEVITEDELRMMVDESLEDGEIKTEERLMIHKVFDFSDACAKEIMVPRVDVVMLDVNSSLDELLDTYRKDLPTRMPVYEDSQDNIVGIFNIKDLVLLENKEGFCLRDHLREPFFTFEHKKTIDLFSTMRRDSISMAIVLDEYGTVSGIVTMEDLLEEIVGEIRDEYDEDEEELFVRLDDRQFIVQGRMNLEDVCRELGLPFESEDYDSIGGYMVGLLDHMPEENEYVYIDGGIYMRVEEMEQNRIGKILIRLPEADKDEETE